ncbi:MAG TPA: Bax inhibitor-1/YccA family protein [Candidatus Limnocylindrales bacterium]|nr:Bax inhibitor-1/YccA family protein [Candidatus Limnocylindrales bacterium]
MFDKDPHRPDRFAATPPSGGQAADDRSSWWQTGQLPGAATARPVAGVRQGFLTMSFVWMFIGLLVSAAAGAFTLANPALLQTAANGFIVFLLAELALVFIISFGINRIGALPALGLFFVYALLNGVTISLIVLLYSTDPVTGEVTMANVQSVVSAFLGASAIFGAAALYGVVTRRDLTSLQGILTVGLVGLIVVMVVQGFFFASWTQASLLISIGGVVIFTALTAVDVQRIQQGRMPAVKNGEAASVIGALALYLDFINLFLFLLRIFGGGRR